MEEMREEYTVAELCEAFEISSSGYYKWREADIGPREQENRRLLEEMHEIHGHRHTRAYGSPRMTLELQERGLACSENRVAGLMAREGLRAKGRRPFRPKTTQSDRHALPAPNRLAEAPPAQAPGEALVSDITYVATREGWLYLAVVIDLFSRAVLGWKIGESLETGLVLDALEGALHACALPPEALFHSDRGCQYTSGIFRSRLAHHGLIQSMSAKGYCYDNAFAESFFATLKTESFPDDGIFDSKLEARRAIFDYLETFYNRRRKHSSLGYLTPEAVIKNHFQNQKQNLN
jgi:transposase InsO family protein